MGDSGPAQSPGRSHREREAVTWMLGQAGERSPKHSLKVS